MKQKTLAVIWVLMAMMAVNPVYSCDQNSACISVGNDLNLNICAEYKGISYGVTLNFVPDPTGLYWKMDVSTFRQLQSATESCIHVEDDLSMKICCANFQGVNYGFTLNYFRHPNDSDGLWWKMDSATLSSSGSGNIKDEIRLAALSLNSLMANQINSVYDVIGNVVFNCDFSASVSAKLSINGSSHNLSASGQAKLYDNAKLVDCNYFFSSDTIFINKADVKGSGNIKGSEISSSFQGTFGINGDTGYLFKWDDRGMYLADFFVINGSGTTSSTVYAGQNFPDLSGTVDKATVSVSEAFDLLDRVSSGKSITLGEIARTVKSGDIYGKSSDCQDIRLHYNGTNLIDVYSSCTSPTHFKVDADTGRIAE